jgi:DNA-binding transcriptional LysR family regulator
VHDIDTILLRTFLSLADSRSFSRTGARIGRSQSAVSAQIRRLETVLGHRLLDRDTRNVALTAEGERLLPHARQMVAAADAMLARFRAPDLSGEVRFGSPEDFASAYLPEILASFSRAHPAVRLSVRCDLTLPLVRHFDRGDLDLIVVKQDPRNPMPGTRALWPEHLVWVAATDLPTDPSLAPRPLPLVLSPAPCVYRARATAALAQAHLPGIEVYASPSFAGAVAAVRAGLGYAVMPRAMVPVGLSVLEDWPPLDPAEIALLAPESPTAAVTALATHVAEEVTRRRG